MNKVFHSMLMLLCITATVFARLGETEAEIDKRYGKAELYPDAIQNHKEFQDLYGLKDYKEKKYLFKNIKIRVTFVKGISSIEIYEGAFTDLQINAFLNDNGKGGQWIKTEGYYTKNIPTTRWDINKDEYFAEYCKNTYFKIENKDGLEFMALLMKLAFDTVNKIPVHK